MSIRYEFVNTVRFPDHFEPDTQYTSRVVDVIINESDMIIQLEYIGEKYTNFEDCLAPVKEDLDYLIHPFVD